MKVFRFLAIFLVGFFLLGSVALAKDIPAPVGHVNDFADILSDGFEQSLEQDLVDFEKETTSEIAVVTINTLGDDNLEGYAVRLFETWEIGKKEKDNGLLLLIAEQERKVRIEVGYGLEPVVTDSRAGRIIRDEITPNFKKEDYEQGVGMGVGVIKDYIRTGEPPVGSEQVQETTTDLFPLIVFGLIGLSYLSAFWGRTKRIWPGGVVGGISGGLLGLFSGRLGSFIFLTIGLGLFGLTLDRLLSKNYKERKKSGKSTGFWSSFGGFSGGGSSGGGGFGGFSGGSSGGGGASGGW